MKKIARLRLSLRKLQKRIRNKEIVVLKTDKSGKLTVMKRKEYEKMGLENSENDQKIDRKELRTIEKRLNDQVRFWTRILNTGKNHDHMDRIMTSKICESENVAPKYFMAKDHKIEGGFRPVVSGCNSDTLGLSNTLSEVIESVCMAIESPYEVVSSEDMLARVNKCNESIREKLKADQSSKVEANENFWDEHILLGTDVKSLFPSLSAQETGLAIRKQFMKSPIKWNNIDWRLATLYIKMNESYWKNGELDRIRKYLPERKSKIGRPPSLGTENLELRFNFPYTVDYLSEELKAEVMGLAMEMAVVFFFVPQLYH